MSRQYFHTSLAKKPRRTKTRNDLVSSQTPLINQIRKAIGDLLRRWRTGWGVKRFTVVVGMVGSLLAIPPGITALLEHITRHDTRISVGHLTILTEPKQQQACLTLNLQAEEFGNVDNELRPFRASLKVNPTSSNAEVPLDADISLMEGEFRKPSAVVAHGGASKNVQIQIVLSLDRAKQSLQTEGTRLLVVELRDKRDQIYKAPFCFYSADGAINFSEPDKIIYGNQDQVGCS